MSIAAVLFACLSLLMLAAHFYRHEHPLLALLCLAAIALAPMKRLWASRFVEVVLWLGAAEWLWTTWTLIGERQIMGRPWTRMAVILLTVAAITAFAAVLKHRHSQLIGSNQ